uniref:Uncharacterized protein LOC116945807 isoform X1 n=1 Tax=Petromyzon marinus TaxID=7757 RepID=A0AAJ7X169_PETMA|nr:uncharacterized protein LOC116945807 isoform X1 [Petromyzon marinus]
MSTVCKHRHRGDKGGRAWCEPPHPHPRIGGRGRHRKLPALANSGRTRTPRWRRVDLHDRRRRVELPAHRLLPECVREGQLGSAPSCGAASVVGTQHQRRHSPTWNCAQVLALPGAAGMATMQHELAGKKQGVGGFPLTATIGDNYLCQPHDGATRGGVRPAVAATASCPTPTHATEMPTPCIVSGFFTNAAKLHHSESYRFVCGRLRFQTVFLFCEDVDDGLVPDPHSPPRTTRAAHFE